MRHVMNIKTYKFAMHETAANIAFPMLVMYIHTRE